VTVINGIKTKQLCVTIDVSNRYRQKVQHIKVFSFLFQNYVDGIEQLYKKGNILSLLKVIMYK